ncbi:MAG TPA: permease prefix domain 1-containing protein [Vicinamibacterales bacterium]|nr:permease prefix domain 1-containing protein [Vicinamibacterales bacterium]
MRSPVETYLCELWRLLRWRPALARRVVREFADHLSEAADRGVRAGVPRDEAESAAVRQMGSPASVAERYRSAGWCLGSLLVAACAATIAIAVWLTVVSIAVLPARDPSHTVLWQIVAAAFGAYGLAAAGYVIFGFERALFRRLLSIMSVAASAGGGYILAMTIRTARAGGAFEGYLLVIGAVLSANGLIAVIYAALMAPPLRVEAGAHAQDSAL